MDIDLLNDFDFSGLDPFNTVVRCETQEEANTFIEYLTIKGIWDEHVAPLLAKRWSEYGSSSCYHVSEAGWCYDSYYEQHYPQYEIVDFCDIYQPRNEYGDLVPAEMMSYEDIMMFADENNK